MSVVILQDEMVHYEVLGRGRPLIFLHGWIGSWRYWIPTMQATSFSFRAYAIDLWGFGDTSKNSSRYSLYYQVELVKDFMEQMGIMKTAVIGHGLGALVGLRYASLFPSAIDRMLIVGAPINGSKVNPRLQTAPPSELAEWLLSKLPTTDAVRTEAPKADQQAITSSINELEQINLNQVVNSLQSPCLFVHGQNDPAISLPPADDFLSLPEHTHQIVFDQSGHFPMLDEMSKFNRLLADFLSLPSGESPRQLQLKEEWKRRVR